MSEIDRQRDRQTRYPRYCFAKRGKSCIIGTGYVVPRKRNKELSYNWKSEASPRRQSKTGRIRNGFILHNVSRKDTPKTTGLRKKLGPLTFQQKRPTWLMAITDLEQKRPLDYTDTIRS